MIIDWKGESWTQHPDPGLVREDDGMSSAGEQDNTKVAVRHLPPSLSEKSFLEQIQPRFAGLYNWVSFHQGKSSHKAHLYSWAHINFNHPQDVFVFFKAFNGRVFVNEKGSQFKVSVEYAPYQQIPKNSTKKDVQEGSILKDPEFLEFLEFLAKPVENLPSAEVQLETREAEKAAGGKEAVIVTPLMEFVRQKRASKAEQQRLHHVSGKANARGYGSLITNGPRSMVDGSSRLIPMYILKSGTQLYEKPGYAPHRGNDTNIIREKKHKELLEGKEKKNDRESWLGYYFEDVSKDNGDSAVSVKDNFVTAWPSLMSPGSSTSRTPTYRQSPRCESGGGFLQSPLLQESNAPLIDNSLPSEKKKWHHRSPFGKVLGTQQLTRRDCALQQEVKEDDCLLSAAEVIKPAKRGWGLTSCGSHERQVWVAKPASGI